MTGNRHLRISAEVREALEMGRGVVALESTIIAHGMPYPGNVKTAIALEEAVRKSGAVPATIAIINGMLRVGLTLEELEHLGHPGSDVIKCSRRDLPLAVAQGSDGATTVAATMIIAYLAGIGVFATGGIGGVHYGAGRTLDISADLQELARTPVAVITAGAKSIVDIGLTLEYLETHGVPVVGYQTDRFPAFYIRDSGFGVDSRLDDPAAIANIIRAKRDLGLGGGMVIANPVPAEYELEKAVIERAVRQAMDDASNEGVTGKKLTPFLLARIEAITGGRSLETNVRLVLNNARLGAMVATSLATGEQDNT